MISIQGRHREGRRKTREAHTSNIRMTADVSSQHFHGENIQKGEQGTALTHPTGSLERVRSGGVTNGNDGAANVSVRKPEPPDKVVTRAHFS